MRRRYTSLQVERENIEQLRTIGMTRGAERWEGWLETPITEDEVWRMLKGVKRNKAPGPDGLSTGFFKTNWNWLKIDIVEILNEMLITGIIHEHQKRGIMIYIPKQTRPITPEGYRPITLMNSDYKMLARIMAHRLKPALKEIPHPNQYGGMKGGGIFDAAATIRDAMAQAEGTGSHYCILSLDFSQAFDKISHEYLF